MTRGRRADGAGWRWSGCLRSWRSAPALAGAPAVDRSLPRGVSGCGGPSAPVIRGGPGDPGRLVVNMSPRDAPDLARRSFRRSGSLSAPYWSPRRPGPRRRWDPCRLVSHIGTLDDLDRRGRIGRPLTTASPTPLTPLGEERSTARTPTHARAERRRRKRSDQRQPAPSARRPRVTDGPQVNEAPRSGQQGRHRRRIHRRRNAALGDQARRSTPPASRRTPGSPASTLSSAIAVPRTETGAPHRRPAPRSGSSPHGRRRPGRSC